MTHRSPLRTLGIALYLLCVAAVTWGAWSYSYAQALGQIAARGESDLALASDRLVAGLLRYRSTAVLLSDHPALADLHSGGPRAAADNLLLETVDKTGAMMALYLDRDGQVLAASHQGDDRERSIAPVFLRASDGALGASHGISDQFGRRAYYFASPSFEETGGVRGILVVAVDIDRLEQEWRASRPAVFFSDDLGQIFVTSRSELLFWKKGLRGFVDPEGELHEVRIETESGHDFWHQSLSPYVPSTALYLKQPLPVIGMTGEALLDVGPAQRLAGLQTGIVAVLGLVLGAVLVVADIRRRTLARANVILETRVKDRTQDLEQANGALRHEVKERQDAEAALRKAQADLVQAGKLSALGQMSAGISHELNQPLMAIRQYAENGESFLTRGRPEKAGENLSRISQLATRAARIITNLRAFARNENEPMGKVDLVGVIQSAVELTEARLASDGVTLDWDPKATKGPVYARGGEVRLSQVFVNLINNAADAMAGLEQKGIRIEINNGDQLSVNVSDSGPGIEDPDRIFEPFYSTKEVGEGMGLGLSISYGLVQSFGGQIRGSNAEHGAMFTVELEYWSSDTGDGSQQG
ncbi:sensor histidine kinase [Tropicibacter sp. R15_0]|uniref:sensor histidine kinase n=1 Tax=Tropicibacter sp. R15_0 TaxID=2821101 RepID=UPI001ADBB9F7|nr:ATP-binding protein [Tropicibacter sp. R15_0]MBO9464513.1 sensor histidine kinase [Tropicibacter sp. R15_0]